MRAQNLRTVDSLETAALTARNEIEKCNALHDLAAEYIDRDNEKALQIANAAEAAAFRSGDSLCSIISQRLKGQVLYRLGRAQEAITTMRPLLNRPSLALYSNEHLSVLNALSISHLLISQFDLGLSYQFQTLQLARKVANSEYAATSLMNIGVTYYKLKNYKKALYFMLKSHRIQDSLNITRFTAPMNISLCHTYLRDFDSAESFLKRSLELCGGECPPTARLHLNYASGCLSFARHEYDQAERAFLTSLELSEESKDFRLFLDNICMLAKIYIHRHELVTARTYLEKGEKVIASGAPFNMEKIKIYEQLAELYKQLKYYEKASLYQAKYIRLKDSIYNEVVTANLMKVESEFRQSENQSKIAAQKAAILDKDLTIQRQAMVNAGAGLLSATMIAFLIVLFRGYRLKKNMNILLEGKVRERTVEIELEVRALTTEVREKELQLRRFSAVLGEAVSSLKGLSNIAGEEMPPHVARIYVSKLDETIDRLAKLN